MTILVCAPHPDDEMIGMGGTIAKYAKAGERVVVVIFTLGEGSHPWQKKGAINETRKKEALQAGKIAGTARTIFLALRDLNIKTEVVEKNTHEDFAAILKKEKPSKVFMPALDDVHADHRSVARFVLSVCEKEMEEVPVWMYTVWNPLHITNRDRPKMVVDISKTIKTKWRAIQAYKSQKVSTFQLIPTVLLRGFFHGLKHGHQVAEVFLKAR